MFRTFAGQMRRTSSLSVNRWSYNTSTESEVRILKPPRDGFKNRIEFT